MLMEDLRSEPSYDIARLEKARKGLARNSDDFYITNGRLEILIRLMREDPSSLNIIEIISSLPWKARSYILTNVVKVLPDGMTNPSYKPKTMNKSAATTPKFRIRNTMP